MAIEAPINQGVIKATVNFDESPPVTPAKEFERHMIFSKKGGGIGTIQRTDEELKALPEYEDSLFGIVLNSKQEHYHNFLIGDGANGEVILKDPDPLKEVQRHLDDPQLTERMPFFSWKSIHPLYEETFVDSTGATQTLNLPLRIEDYINQGTSANPLTEAERRLQQSAKWQYVPVGVSAGNFGFNNSALANDDKQVSKIVPTQIQVQGRSNGPTGKGVHWGLQKTSRLPDRVGFYLDIYLNKKLDNPTSSSAPAPAGGGTHPLNFKWPQHKFLFGGVPQSGFNVDDVYSGYAQTPENNLFYLYNKSYILIELFRNSNKGDYFFLLITTNDSPKFFKVNSTGGSLSNPSSLTGSIDLISQYELPGDSESSLPIGYRLLNGNDRHLRLQFRNILGNIIIENNVFDTPWVIPVSVFKAPSNQQLSQASGSVQQNRTIDARGAGKSHILTLGGAMRIFGGNISCGISYTHLNVFSKGSLDLDEIRVFGNRSNFGTYFTSFAKGNDIPKELMTKAPTGLGGAGPLTLSPKESYYYNSATLITDNDGTADLRNSASGSFRRDVDTSGSGQLVTESVLRAVDTTNSTTITAGTGQATLMSLETSIELEAGVVRTSYTPSGYFAQVLANPIAFNMGYTLTPVLMYCRQNAEIKNVSVGNNPIDISSIVEDIDLTWQSEEYHTVNGSGSMTLQVYRTPSDSPATSAAKQAVLSSIGKSRYVSIDLELSCTDFNEGGSRFFTGIALNPQLNEMSGQRHLKFDLVDFWTILDNSLIINSPYFDGAIDTDVIDFLMKNAGFPSTGISFPGPPSTDALGISFSFNEPLEKFDDKTQVSEAVKKYAKRYSKFAKFNRNGVFEYQQLPAVLFSASTTGSTSIPVQFRFFSTHLANPNLNIAPIGPQEGATGINTLTKQSQVAYETKNTGWNLKDVVNKIVLRSIDARTRGYILVVDTNYPSLTDPTSVGYLGYEKPFIQDEAAFGDIFRAKKIARYYSRMYRPPYTMTWRTIGGNNLLNPLDVVAVDGKLVVINSIRHTINAKENKWETDYEGEWIFTPLSTFSGDPSGSGSV